VVSRVLSPFFLVLELDDAGMEDKIHEFASSRGANKCEGKSHHATATREIRHGAQNHRREEQVLTIGRL